MKSRQNEKENTFTTFVTILLFTFILLIPPSFGETYEIILHKGWNMLSIPFVSFQIIKVEGRVYPTAYIYNLSSEKSEALPLSSLSSQVGAIWVYSYDEGSKIIVEGTVPFSFIHLIKEQLPTSAQKTVWSFASIPKGGLLASELKSVCENIRIYYLNASDNCWYSYNISSKEYKRYCKDKWELLGILDEFTYPEGIGVWLKIDKNCHSKKVVIEKGLERCKNELESCSQNEDCCPGLVCSNGVCVLPTRFFCKANSLIYWGMRRNVTECKYCCEGPEDCGVISACCKDEPCKGKGVPSPILLCPYRCMEAKTCEALGGTCLPTFSCSLRIAKERSFECCCYLPCKSENQGCLKHEECCQGLKCIDGVCRRPEYCAKEDCSADVSCQINKDQLIVNGSIFGYKEKGQQGSCEKIGTKVCKVYACNKENEGSSVGCKEKTYYCCLTSEGFKWQESPCVATCSGKVTLSLVPPLSPTPTSTVKPGDRVTAIIGGLSNCKGTAYLKDAGGCENGKTIATCQISNSGCQLDFTAPTQPGTYTYYACFDVNSDGKYSSGEYDSKTLTVKEACDSKNYTLCNLAFDFDSSSGTKSNMCGSEQYYKVSTPAGQKCDVIWSIGSDIPESYYLYVKWEDSCPSANDFDCATFTRFGRQKASCFLSEFSGTSSAVVKRNPRLPQPLSEGIERTYNITVLLTNCKPVGS
jgi:hypothetical protein